MSKINNINKMNKTIKPILSVKNIKKSYFTDKEELAIFKDLSFDINDGDHISIMGSSGSGKSTLLTLLAGLDRPDSGHIFFENNDITKFSENKLSYLHRDDFGFVFQSFYLVPSLNVLENVMFPLELKGISNKDAKDKAMEMLKRVNLIDKINSFPHQISGGESQRTAIARSLINKPKILFADEPTGNLDEKNSDQVMKLLLELKKEYNLTMIVVTHDMKIAKKSDYIMMLEHNKLHKINN